MTEGKLPNIDLNIPMPPVKPPKQLPDYTAHVVFDPRVAGVRCLRCGATLMAEMPIDFKKFETSAESFIRAHADCKEMDTEV